MYTAHYIHTGQGAVRTLLCDWADYKTICTMPRAEPQDSHPLQGQYCWPCSQAERELRDLRSAHWQELLFFSPSCSPPQPTYYPSKARQTIFQMPKPRDKLSKDHGTGKRRVSILFMFLLSFLNATHLQFLHSSEPGLGSTSFRRFHELDSNNQHLFAYTSVILFSLPPSLSFLLMPSLKVNVQSCLTIQSPLRSTSRPFPESAGGGIRPEICLGLFLSRGNGITLAHVCQGASMRSTVLFA